MYCGHDASFTAASKGYRAQFLQNHARRHLGYMSLRICPTKAPCPVLCNAHLELCLLFFCSTSCTEPFSKSSTSLSCDSTLVIFSLVGSSSCLPMMLSGNAWSSLREEAYLLSRGRAFYSGVPRRKLNKCDDCVDEACGGCSSILCAALGNYPLTLPPFTLKEEMIKRVMSPSGIPPLLSQLFETKEFSLVFEGGSLQCTCASACAALARHRTTRDTCRLLLICEPTMRSGFAGMSHWEVFQVHDK